MFPVSMKYNLARELAYEILGRTLQYYSEDSGWLGLSRLLECSNLVTSNLVSFIASIYLYNTCVTLHHERSVGQQQSNNTLKFHQQIFPILWKVLIHNL